MSSHPSQRRRSRLRMAAGAFSFLWMALMLRSWLASGELVIVVAAVAWLVFWGSIFVMPTVNEQDVTDADHMRTHLRRQVVVSGTFTLVFLGLVLWGARQYDFQPAWLIPVAIPAVLTAVSGAIWLNVDRLSAKARARFEQTA